MASLTAYGSETAEESDALVENIRGLIREAKVRGIGIRQIISGLDNMVRQKDHVIDYSKFSTSQLSRAIDLALDGLILECGLNQQLQESKSPRPTGSARTSLPPMMTPSSAAYSRAPMPYDQPSTPRIVSSPPLRSQSPSKLALGSVASVTINTGK